MPSRRCFLMLTFIQLQLYNYDSTRFSGCARVYFARFCSRLPVGISDNAHEVTWVKIDRRSNGEGITPNSCGWFIQREFQVSSLKVPVAKVRKHLSQSCPVALIRMWTSSNEFRSYLSMFGDKNSTNICQYVPIHAFRALLVPFYGLSVLQQNKFSQVVRAIGLLRVK